MLALEALSTDLTALIYVVAFVALTLAAVLSFPVRSAGFWLAAGLAAYVFVAAWDALAAT